MSYQNAIPQPTNKISISQGDLLGNFQEVNTAWNANHVPFNLVNEGSHWFVSMPNQTLSASFPPATNGVGIYANQIGLYAIAGNLWFRPSGQAVGVATNDINITDTTGSIATGWYKFPNRLIMKWANSASLNTMGVKTLTLSATPVINTILSISLTGALSGVTQDKQPVFTFVSFDIPTQKVTFNYDRSFALPGGATTICKCLIVGV